VFVTHDQRLAGLLARVPSTASKWGALDALLAD
jgi:hypothetical protein